LKLIDKQQSVNDQKIELDPLNVSHKKYDFFSYETDGIGGARGE